MHNVWVLDIIEDWVRVLVQVHIVPLEHLQEAFGLLLQIGWPLDDFLNDFTVAEVLQAVVNLASLLVLPHQSLRAIKEAFVKVDKGLFLTHLLFPCVNHFVHDWLVGKGLFHHVLAVSAHKEDVLETVSADLLSILIIAVVVRVDLFL